MRLYLNDAHTNMIDIEDGLELLWRNDIPADKVTMGLAFYGRGFTVSNPSCITPGCTYNSWSFAGDCSYELYTSTGARESASREGQLEVQC